MAITENNVWCHLVDHNFKGLDLPFRVDIEDETIVTDVRKKVTAIYQVVPPRRLFVWRCKDPMLLLDPADDDSVDRIICSIDFNDQTKAIRLGGGLNVIELGLAEYEVLLVQLQDEPTEVPDNIPELPEYQRYNRIVLERPSSESANSSEHGSTQQNPSQAIYNGLVPEFAPFNTVAPPIHLYHPIFGEFTSLARDSESQVAIHDQVQALELMRKMSVVYEGEAAYSRAVNPILGKLLGFESMDNVAAGSLLQVVKLSTGSNDLSTQAGVSMRRDWIDSSRRSIREKCCCPTFIIAASGPWFSIMGAILTDKIIVQPLTDLRWSAVSSTMEESRILASARIFVALRTCLNKLKDYYGDVMDSNIPPLLPNIPHPRFFPYPTSLTKADGSEVEFEYIKPLEDVPTCVTFLAKTIGNSFAEKLVVKFVSRYGNDVQEYLAHKNRAPKLYYYGPLSSVTGSTGASDPPNPTAGGMKIVVMEYIESKPNQVIPPNARKQLEEILTDLHSQGFVFGDLRWPNILFNKSQRAFLIDFNWGGRYDTKMMQNSNGIPKGIRKDVWENIKARVARMESVDFSGVYARYPLAISQVDGMWVDGVGPGELILPDHDWGMLDKLDFSNQ